MAIQNRLLADKEKDSKLGAWSDKHDTFCFTCFLCLEYYERPRKLQTINILQIYSSVYRALLTYKRGELSEKVWRVAHGNHLKDLVLVVELFPVLKNMLLPAIGVQDEVRLWLGADGGSALNPGKADAGQVVGVARCLQILVDKYVVILLTRHFLLKQGVSGQEPRLVQKVFKQADKVIPVLT